MITKDYSNSSKSKHSCCQPVHVDVRKAHSKNSTCTCLQNEELSSKEKDSQQIMETSLQPVYCNSLDDRSVHLKSVAKIVESPDEKWLKIVENALKASYPYNP